MWIEHLIREFNCEIHYAIIGDKYIITIQNFKDPTKIINYIKKYSNVDKIRAVAERSGDIAIIINGNL